MLVALVLAALAATFVGGLFPLAQSWLSRAGLWRIFAFRSGILLSVTFIDVLPQAWKQDPALAGWGALAAIVLFYTAASFAMVDSCPEYLEECTTHVLGWAALVGLFIHSLMDGVNLAVSFGAGAAAGLAVGTAMTLHKLADGFTLTSLFGQSGYTRGQTLFGLCAVAAATPLGVALSSRLMAAAGPSALLLGFAGGSFIYIGAAEILPRLHKTRDRLAFGCFLAGIVAMTGLHAIAG